MVEKSVVKEFDCEVQLWILSNPNLFIQFPFPFFMKKWWKKKKKKTKKIEKKIESDIAIVYCI